MVSIFSWRKGSTPVRCRSELELFSKPWSHAHVETPFRTPNSTTEEDCVAYLKNMGRCSLMSDGVRQSRSNSFLMNDLGSFMVYRNGIAVRNERARVWPSYAGHDLCCGLEKWAEEYK